MSKQNLNKAWLLSARRNGHDIAQQLSGHPNVAYITVGGKRKNGEWTGLPAFIAYVRSKGSVQRKHHIPDTVLLHSQNGKQQTIATDVVELPSDPQVFGARGGDIMYAADGDFGTACLTFVKNNRGYVATCAHVVGNVIQRTIKGSPGIQEPSTGKIYQLLAAEYISQFPPGGPTSEDLAIIGTGTLPIDPMSILGETSPITGFAPIQSNIGGKYWYSTNNSRIECIQPQPTPLNYQVSMKVDGAWYPYSNFWSFWVNSGMPAPGHSGSVLCFTNSNNQTFACGIVFGGAPPKYAYVFALQPALNSAIARLP